MSVLLRQPLLHFLLLGALVFGLDSLLRPHPVDEVVVSSDMVAALRTDMQRRGETSEASLEAAIDATIEDEILLREAKRLGLDQGDPIVRRRLAQVMRFFLAESSPPRDPSEAELRAHLKANAERYKQPARMSFEHHFFRGDQAMARREQAALALAANEPVKGDAFAHGSRLTAQSQTRLEQRFGPGFARRAMTLKAGPSWHAVDSAFGLHLVRVSAQVPAGMPKLKEVASALRKDWLRQHNRQAVIEGIKALKKRYSVKRP